MPRDVIHALGAHPGSPADWRFHATRRRTSLARITGRSLTEVDGVLEEAEHVASFAEADRRLHEYPSLGQFRAGRELFALVRLLRPERIVETGVGSGYSSIHTLEALRRNGAGRLFSIDLPNNDPTFRLPEGQGAGFLVPSELRDRWELRLGDSYELLPRLLSELGEIDVFFHDSLHSYDLMMFEFRTAYPRVRKGGVILSDDVIGNASFLDFARAVSRPVGFLEHRPGRNAEACLPVAVLVL